MHHSSSCDRTPYYDEVQVVRYCIRKSQRRGQRQALCVPPQTQKRRHRQGNIDKETDTSAVCVSSFVSSYRILCYSYIPTNAKPPSTKSLWDLIRKHPKDLT